MNDNAHYLGKYGYCLKIFSMHKMIKLTQRNFLIKSSVKQRHFFWF